MKNPDWLLDCEPRPAQTEALRRSYLGFKLHEHKDDDNSVPVYLPHADSPAIGWGHFMEMRVGKTPTLLNEYMLFKRDHGVKKCFMLSPSKYKETWGEEATRFGLDVPVHVYQSSPKGRKAFVEFMKHPEGFVVVNYEAMQYASNMGMFDEWVDDKTFMGADESVTIKSHSGLPFKNAMHLASNAAVTRASTGCGF